ncbi:hypothetical protein NE237_016110 [Protea cynaroides]|uniref:Uncharacterized protein n=1 Tax=Protea cynaroides TaxID=273540 RepID=A0A9Q0KFC2_9MAGN|nr:hypothetical protein NE237_016110 [Protea cynaroides]
MSFKENSIDCVQQCHDRISSKRKLDDYGASDEDFSNLLKRMKKHDDDAVNLSAQGYARLGHTIDFETRVSDTPSASCIRYADARIRKINGIPIIEQRLTYRGKKQQIWMYFGEGQGNHGRPCSSKANIMGEDGSSNNAIVAMDSISAIYDGNPKPRRHRCLLVPIDHVCPHCRGHARHWSALTTVQYTS